MTTDEVNDLHIASQRLLQDPEYADSWHLAVARMLQETACGIEKRGVTARLKPAEIAAVEAARRYLETAQ